MNITTPVFAVPSLWPALPEILLAVGALAMILIGAIRGQSAATQRVIDAMAIALMGIALLIVLGQDSARVLTFERAFVSDSFARFMKVLTLAGSMMAVLLAIDYMKRRGIEKFEYPILITLATLGMLMMISANDLISLYIGLELQSLAAYVLASIHRDDARSSEAGLKYFVLGALSSGMLLYGASLIYGFTGNVTFDGIAAALQGKTPGTATGATFGLVFLAAGIAFKCSAAPFHMWTPDVYEGSPTPGDRLLRQRAEDGGGRPVHAGHDRRFPDDHAPVAADHHLPRHRLDGAGRLRRHRPAQHQAPHGLFLDRQHRLRAGGACRRQRGGRAGRRGLHGDLPRHDARRLRLHHGAEDRERPCREHRGSRRPRTHADPASPSCSPC